MEAPARPRAERMRLQLREEIVRAATEVFAERGYHRTGIADIARRVGVGNSSIYAHFTGKRALFDVVIDDALRGVTELLTAENAPATADTLEAYEDQVRRIAAGFAVALREDPSVLRLLRGLLVEAGDVDDELAGRAAAFMDGAANVTAAYLGHGRARGYLRADLDVEATARIVNAMVFSVALELAHRDASAQETQRVIDATLALFFSGVRR